MLAPVSPQSPGWTRLGGPGPPSTRLFLPDLGVGHLVIAAGRVTAHRWRVTVSQHVHGERAGSPGALLAADALNAS